jgi:hypothetical protein
MDMAELEAELQRLGVDRARYSLRGGTPEDGIGIERQGNEWRVYYSERGGRANIQTHSTEDAACQQLLALIAETPGTRGAN